MASPYLTILGISCALDELSEQCNLKDDYGQGAILDALRARLADMTAPFEWIEDLADSRPDNKEKMDRSIERLTTWAEEWRKRRA